MRGASGSTPRGSCMKCDDPLFGPSPSGTFDDCILRSKAPPITRKMLDVRPRARSAQPCRPVSHSGQSHGHSSFDTCSARDLCCLRLSLHLRLVVVSVLCLVGVVWHVGLVGCLHCVVHAVVWILWEGMTTFVGSV